MVFTVGFPQVVDLKWEVYVNGVEKLSIFQPKTLSAVTNQPSV